MRYSLVGWAAAVAVAVAGATDAMAFSSRVACLDVPADVEWQATGVDLQAGDAVCVRAHALWSHGQEAGDIEPFHGALGYIFKRNLTPPPIVPFPFARVGALLGKIGEAGVAFPIEDGLCFRVSPTPGDTAGLPGQLLLSMNDVPGSFDDNDGAARVSIAVDRSPDLEARWRPDRSGFDRLERQVARGGCLR